MVIWDVVQCCLVNRYQCFGVTCCHFSPWGWKQEIVQKHWYFIHETVWYPIPECWSLSINTVRTSNIVFHGCYLWTGGHHFGQYVRESALKYLLRCGWKYDRILGRNKNNLMIYFFVYLVMLWVAQMCWMAWWLVNNIEGILIVVFHCFPQSLQADIEISASGHDYLLPNPFQFIIRL
jgi:hypothetical protein